MTFDQFISKHLGKAMDYDGVSGVQCVDLIKYYLDEVFGIKPGAWGDARNYYESFTSYSALTNNFTRISGNNASFVPKKGDIVVWGANVSSNHNCGHIAIGIGGGTHNSFSTYDQNWNQKAMAKTTHSHTHSNGCPLLGVLRPKDQSKITGSTGGTTTGSFPTAKNWKNGSTSETVYKLSNLTENLGSLSANETAKCYRKVGGSYLVVYNLSGTTKHKAGFVKYAGGVTSAPTASKTYKNGSTSETIYADTAKKTTIGSLDQQESCQCIGKVDGMYLVCYKVNGTSNYKCGFAAYSGGC